MSRRGSVSLPHGLRALWIHSMIMGVVGGLSRRWLNRPTTVGRICLVSTVLGRPLTLKLWCHVFGGLLIAGYVCPCRGRSSASPYVGGQPFAPLHVSCPPASGYIVVKVSDGRRQRVLDVCRYGVEVA